MGIAERKERQRESLRQEIIDAARDTLLTRGYAKLSMRGIAERIEYSPTTLYLYFKNKEDILYYLSEEALERQFNVMNTAGSRKSTPVQRLRAVLRAYIDFGLAEPDRYKIVYMADVSQHVNVTRLLRQGGFADKVIQLTIHSIADVVKDSKHTADPESLFQVLWAHCHGIVSLLIGRPAFPWIEREKLIEKSLDASLTWIADGSK